MKITRLICVAIASLLMSFSGKTYATELERLIEAGRCDDADALADRVSKTDVKLLIYAAVAYDCRKNKDAALHYIRQAASLGNAAAIKALIEEGETPPSIVSKPQESERKSGIDWEAAGRWAEQMRQRQESRRPVETRCSRVGNEVICRSQ